MPSIPEAFAIAVQQHQSRNLRQAEEICRQIVQVAPQYADAWYLLGRIAYDAGNHAVGVDCLGRALALTPHVPVLHRYLGLCYRAMGKLDETIARYRRALELQPDYVEALCSLGNALEEQGDRDEAEACYRRALDREPNHTPSLNNLGITLKRQGKLDEAVVCYRLVVQLKPDFTAAHNNLGNVLKEQGQIDEAVACYQRALQVQPDSVDAYNGLAVILLMQGKLDEAVAYYRHALELKPDFAKGHNNLGNALKAQDQLEAAEASYRRALELNPNFAEAHTNLGNVLQAQGTLDAAVASHRQALELKPDFAEAHSNLGTALKEQRKLDEAVACYRQALALNPSFAEAHSNFGCALSDLGRLEEAEACHLEAIRVDPRYVGAHSNLGVTLKRQGKLDEALACLEHAFEIDPDVLDAHHLRAEIWLLRGDFGRGLVEYEWRWKSKTRPMPPFPQPLWDGSPLGGRTILVHAEQGLGDSLQFIRFAPLVKERGGRVLVRCRAPLFKLLASCEGFEELLVEGSPLPPFDVHAPLLSLPRMLATTLDTIPNHVPYIHTDPALLEKWRERLKPLEGFKVGIAWQGNPLFPGDRVRSVPLKCFEPLAQLPGVRLMSLQKNHGLEQIAELADRFTVTELGADVDDAAGPFMDTAAIMQNLDLIITSDTATAHLAGALGVPVWVALPYMPDWRWLLNREDSPWYPTMRLFRQPTPGDWKSVFEGMASALRSKQETIS